MKGIFKRSKLHEGTTEIDSQVKECQKNIEDKLASPMLKVIRSESARIAAANKFWKDATALADVLSKLSSKDLSKDGNDAAFVLAWTKFSDLFRDIATKENSLWANECTEKFIQPASNFLKSELTDQALRKTYDKATDDYSEILARLDSLHKDPKKATDIIKLYTAEKERVRLKKIYDEATNDFLSFCMELNERVNFDFMDMMVAGMTSQYTAVSHISRDLSQIEAYLAELSTWCEEEKVVFTQSSQERQLQRKEFHDFSKADEIRHFLNQFDTTLIQIARPVVSRGELAVDIVPLLFTALQAHKLPTPQGVEAGVAFSGTPDAAIEALKQGLKANFDALGIELENANHRDKLISIAEALSSIEQVTLLPSTPGSP